MLNSIEIPDSDDEIPEPAMKMSKSTTQASDATGSTSNKLQTTAQVRHRSRKTQHTVRNATETEIQFEGVPLDEEDGSQSSSQEHRLSDNDSIKSVVKNMLDSEEVQEIIKRIANERVRCNFLLATYQLADMNFSLNTHPDVLRHQFRERLKRKDRMTTTQKTNSTP